MKKLRFAFILIAGLFFFTIIIASSVRNIYLSSDAGKGRLGFMANPIKFLAETPSLMKQIVAPPEFLFKNSKSKDGFTYFDEKTSHSYPSLLVGYKTEKYGSKFDLLDINTGKVLKNWSPDNETLFQQAFNDDNPRKPPSEQSDLYYLHPLMLKDSSLLITAQLTSLLAKIDVNNKVLWLKNDRTYHHSLELDEDGNVFSCTRPFESAQYDFLPTDYDLYKNTLVDDHITQLNPDTGDILFDKSVIAVLLENGYEKVLLGKGQITSDLTHLNDIQPALSSSEYWQKGDLLISCRNLSTVFLYRPSTNKILWLKTSPWYNQHDVDFYEQDKIVVFGNDDIREESKEIASVGNQNLFFSNKRSHNEVYVYNFVTDSISTPFTQLLKEEEISTLTSGRCDILSNGDIFVEDTNHGRIIIGDSIAKKIEYVKRHDKDNISSLYWSRIVN
ncbi:Arylsulfotransferase (ASST) [Pricia antarctica]|uniref:Arylsulfotransferase (ASST) n=1 Tax=Pricia antarctica TaxID=641691 RepID=A0A1G7FLC8_9FLAO|nr:arylsulfotransferase family protein [Pricia antarctica]SDE76741.1 Arylsulfotransferase (ASST) [Pricia antarctica]